MRSLAVALVAVACAPAPVSPERAAELCRNEPGLADGVAGTVGVGVGTGGGKAKGSIVLTDRVFNPEDPQDAFAACVRRKVNGEPDPTRFGITIGAST